MTEKVTRDGKLVSADRAYQDRTAEAQERIAAALERIADAFTAAPADSESICVHPLEARTDTSTMGHPRWVCEKAKGGCGFSVGMEDT